MYKGCVQAEGRAEEQPNCNGPVGFIVLSDRTARLY